jgi:hypothetical protein
MLNTIATRATRKWTMLRPEVVRATSCFALVSDPDLQICTSSVTSSPALWHTNQINFWICTTTTYYSLQAIFLPDEKHATSTIAAQIAHTSPNDGRQRYGLRGPLSLSISSAPEQTIRRVQLPRVCKEKDNRCVQGSQCGDRCAQNARVDAEGSQGAAGVEGVYYWLSECWRVCDCMGVQTSVIYEIHGIVPGRMTD